MGRLTTLLLGILAFILFSWYCVQQNRFRIQSAVENNAKSSIAYLNEPQAKITTDGRDITLSGKVSSTARITQMIDAIKNTDGVRTVTSTLDLISDETTDTDDTADAIEVKQKALGSISLINNNLIIQGDIPSGASQLALSNLIAKYDVLPDSILSVNTDVDDAIIQAAGLMAKNAEKTKDLHIELDKDRVSISGTVIDSETKSKLINELERMVGSRELAVQIAVSSASKKPDTEITQAANNTTTSVQSEAMLTSELSPQAIDETIDKTLDETTVLATEISPRDETEKKISAEANPSIKPPAKAVNQALNTQQCKETLKTQLRRQGIEFKNTSNEFTQSSLAHLDRLVDVLLRCPTRHQIMISGHTDSNGDRDMNLRLSLSRAQAVSHYFSDNNLDADRLQVIGFGESRPIDDNDTSQGRQRNRRIELSLLNAR